jgi:hypothetical protein
MTQALLFEDELDVLIKRKIVVRKKGKESDKFHLDDFEVKNWPEFLKSKLYQEINGDIIR